MGAGVNNSNNKSGCNFGYGGADGSKSGHISNDGLGSAQIKLPCIS